MYKTYIQQILYYSLCKASAGSIFMALRAGIPIPMAIINAIKAKLMPPQRRKRPASRVVSLYQAFSSAYAKLKSIAKASGVTRSNNSQPSLSNLVNTIPLVAPCALCKAISLLRCWVRNQKVPSRPRKMLPRGKP